MCLGRFSRYAAPQARLSLCPSPTATGEKKPAQIAMKRLMIEDFVKKEESAKVRAALPDGTCYGRW